MNYTCVSIYIEERERERGERETKKRERSKRKDTSIRSWKENWKKTNRTIYLHLLAIKKIEFKTYKDLELIEKPGHFS